MPVCLRIPLHCIVGQTELESMSKQGLLCYARIFTFSHSVTLVNPVLGVHSQVNSLSNRSLGM